MVTKPDLRVVIMAGGSGTRFWPLSRQSKPKQFLKMGSGDLSLIANTARRMLPAVEADQILVVTNKMHVDLVRQHLPNVRILGEPVGRNTAASIGWAAVMFRHLGLNPINIVLPADHNINSEDIYHDVLLKAIHLASEQSLLVTLGINPTFPHTGYGYIKRGQALQGDSYLVEKFVEKPDLALAEQYFSSGDYYWNSGMFIWRNDVILAAIEKLMPDLYSGLLRLEAAFDSSDEQSRVDEIFSTLPSQSIDYGVLERAENKAVVVSDDFGWNDVGSWDQWAEYIDSDEDGNAVQGDAIALNSKNCVVCSDKNTTVVFGAEDLIVINAGDAVLVCPRDAVQDIKKVVEELQRRGRNDLL